MHRDGAARWGCRWRFLARDGTTDTVAAVGRKVATQTVRRRLSLRKEGTEVRNHHGDQPLAARLHELATVGPIELRIDAVLYFGCHIGVLKAHNTVVLRD